MTIANRLNLLVAVPLVVLIALGVFAKFQLDGIEARSRFVAETQIASLAMLGNISRSFTELRLHVRNHLLARNQAERDESRASLRAEQVNLTRLLGDYADHLISDEKDRRLMNEVRDLSREYVVGAEKAMSLSDEGHNDEALAALLGPMAQLGAALAKVSSEWIQYNEQLATRDGRAAVAAIEALLSRMLLAVGLALAFSALMGFVTFRGIVHPIRGLQTTVEAIAGGDYAKAVPFTDAANETGALARSIDILKNGAAAMNEQRWIKVQIATLTGELQGAASLDDFGQRLVSGLLPILGGGVGSLYLFESNPEQLRRIASYGLRDGDAAEVVQPGEGLIGQSARERKPLTLTNLPSNYLPISSGLGKAAPTQVVAWPLVSQDALIAVLEVASFRVFTVTEKALLEELLPVVAMSMEILQRSLRTQELLEQVRHQNFLADSALDLTQAGYWHVPLDGSGWYNSSERAARIFGDLPSTGYRYRLDDWAAHVHEGDEEAARVTMENFTAAVEGTIPVYDAIYAYKRPVDGRVVWIHALGHVVKDANDKPTDMFGVTQDITTFKQLETDLRLAMQKSEEATKAKSAFLANMSHEIRTPMNGIIGMTELALDSDLSTEQRDYLNTVKSSADALLSLINDILDFSKIEAGRIELDPIDFLVRDSISDTLNPLALRAASKGLELAYDVHPDVPDALIGDIYRLRQVIVNLVGNAIKFTQAGEVVVSVSLVQRSGDDLLLEVAVRDTGIGISPEAAARLFKPFEQADAATTRKYGGTGLGLAISLQLVQLMGGQIRLESTPGAGSTFIFTVRFKAGIPRVGASPDDAARVFQGKTGLVVDDNETNRRILTTMLGHWGLRTVQADSASHALAALDRASNVGQPASVLITDLHMPGMDGFQLIEAVRSRADGRELPVLLLTSSASPGDQERSVQLRVAARLLKPVKQSLLLDNLVRVFAGASRIETRQPPAESPDRAAEQKRLRVLLAEDNPVNQKFAIQVLERAGHEVTVAQNGSQAVDLWGSRGFDVVLMDVQMPEMDGLEATRAIRSREAESGRRTPIIAMTANAMAGDREMCIDAGMDGYVAKPVKKDLLFAEIARVAGHHEVGDRRGTSV